MKDLVDSSATNIDERHHTDGERTKIGHVLESIPPPTDRLRFRTYTIDDADAVADMFADELARRFYPSMDQPGAAERWIQANLDSYRRHGFGLWVIETKESAEFLGDCGLTIQTVDGRRLVEVGYHLTVARRGNGYATDAARACIDFAFRAIGLSSVCSIVDPANTASIAVASHAHTHRRVAEYRDRRVILFWTDRAVYMGEAHGSSRRP